MIESPLVRHFRQIVLWPLQLMPVRPGNPVQRHWEVLDQLAGTSPWHEVADEFCEDPAEFQERHYKEFVTFLPYTQRFLYGTSAGQESSQRLSDPSIHVYRRRDIQGVRVTFERGEQPWQFKVAHVDLNFFHDADLVLLAVELHADDLPLNVAQDTLFRFGRAYPAFWDARGEGGNCPHLVEWLAADDTVLAQSDYGSRSRYLEFVGRHRTPCNSAHWDWLLQPLTLEVPGQRGPLQYRQLEYYRMPFMSYLALDDPMQLSRADWIRLGLVTRPGGRDDLPYSASTLHDFESEYCDDRFWDRTGERVSGDTRFIVTGQTLSMVGNHRDAFFSGAENGLLSQFRHQYFLLFLIAHFHKAALLSMSDELAVAMNRLTVGDTESVKNFKRTIRQMMETFLRFTHRYWFHEVSNQEIARNIFDRLRRHLGNEALHAEVRNEVIDMNSYLDSDSARRQANTVLRLTVVTIVGLIGTIATGVLGMNVFSEADRSSFGKLALFLVVLVATGTIAIATIVKSKRLADFLDALSDERVPWKSKFTTLRAASRASPRLSRQR
jgi:hypothetical protein